MLGKVLELEDAWGIEQYGTEPEFPNKCYGVRHFCSGGWHMALPFNRWDRGEGRRCNQCHKEAPDTVLGFYDMCRWNR